MKKSAVFLTLFSLYHLAFTGGAHSLSLAEGLAIVTSEGRDVRIAETRAQAAEARLDLARSRRLPSVETFADQTWLRYQPEARFGGGSTSPIAEKESLRYGISLHQLVTDFGRTGAGIMGAEARARSRDLSTRQTRNDSAIDFFVTYVDLLEAEHLLAVADEEVRSFEAHLSDARALYEEGMVTVNDTLQAEVNLADALQRRISVRDDRALKAARINYLLSRNLSDPVVPEEIVPSPLPDFTDADNAADIALQTRLELEILDLEIDFLESEREEARADHYPSVFVSGGYLFEENRYRVHEDNWSLTAGVTWDLYSGGSKGAEVARAEAEVSGLRIQRERTAAAIQLEVKKAFLALTGSRDREAVAKKAVRQAEESLRLQRARYEEGEGTATEVTDAVTLLARTEQNYWTALYSVRRAEAAVLYATGTDLVEALGKEN
ncbi:MAG: TolC family protein [bacterium]|nr:MAG: TolC family protein [bacterium]